MEALEVCVLSTLRQPTSLLLFDPSASEADWTCLLELDERGEATGFVPRRTSSPTLTVMTTWGFFSVNVGKRSFLEGPSLSIDVGSKGGEDGDEKGISIVPELPKSPEILGEVKEGFFFPSFHPITLFSPFDSWRFPPTSTPSIPLLAQALKAHGSLLERLVEHRRYPINARALCRKSGTFLDEALNVAQSFHELASLKRVPPEMVEWIRLARKCDLVVTETDWALVSPVEVVTEGWLKGLEVQEAQVHWNSPGDEALVQGFSYRLGCSLWFTETHTSVGANKGRPFGAVAGPPFPPSIPLPVLPEA